MRSYFLLFFLLTISISAFADARTFEISFGTSQLLVDDVDRADLKDRKKVVLPTTGALFIAEYFWNDSWGSLFAFNMPLVTQKFIVNNELIEETASESYLIGQRYTPIRWHVTKTAIISPQFGAFFSVILGGNPQVSPSLGGRLNITDDAGFDMYLGSVVTYGIKGYVLFYGIGHQF